MTASETQMRTWSLVVLALLVAAALWVGFAVPDPPPQSAPAQRASALPGHRGTAAPGDAAATAGGSVGAPLRAEGTVGEQSGTAPPEVNAEGERLMSWSRLPTPTQCSIAMIADCLRDSKDMSDAETDWRRSIRLDPAQAPGIEQAVRADQLALEVHANEVLAIVEPIADQVERAEEVGDPVPRRLASACTVFEGRTFEELGDLQDRLPDGVMVRRQKANDAWVGIWIDSSQVQGLGVAWSAMRAFKGERRLRYLSLWRRITR